MNARTGSSRTATSITLGVLLIVVLGLPFVFRPAEVEVAAHGEEPASDLPEKKLVIISPHWEGVRTEFGRAFNAYTVQKFGHRTKLEWLDVGGTSDAVRYVKSEFTRTPDGVKIDLFFGGGVDPYLQFMQNNLLCRCDLPAEVLDAIPQKFAGIEIYDAEQRWFGACLSGFGILYNKPVLRALDLEPPPTWEALGRPEYFTWVGSGDPRSSGSVHMVYEIIPQAYGWEKGWAAIVRMAGNIRSFSRSASQVPRDCAVGEIAMGMAIDVYAWRQIAKSGSDRMGFLLPEGVTVVNPDAMAVLKGAPDKDLAEKFIAFVISEPGQKLWAFKLGAPGGPKEFELNRMSIIPGFAQRYGEQASVKFDAYSWKGGFLYDSDKGSTRWGILNDLIGACIIDTHEELVRAWQRVSKLPAHHPLAAELVAPPITEKEMLELARGKWGEQEFRTRTVARWVREAKERYCRIARGE